MLLLRCWRCTRHPPVKDGRGKLEHINHSGVKNPSQTGREGKVSTGREGRVSTGSDLQHFLLCNMIKLHQPLWSNYMENVSENNAYVLGHTSFKLLLPWQPNFYRHVSQNVECFIIYEVGWNLWQPPSCSFVSFSSSGEILKSKVVNPVKIVTNCKQWRNSCVSVDVYRDVILLVSLGWGVEGNPFFFPTVKKGANKLGLYRC